MRRSFTAGSVARACRHSVTILLLVSVMFLSGAAGVRADEIVCIQCHTALPEKYSQPVKLWRGSIHDENGIACNSCHGGDPGDAANAMTKERGFLGVPAYNAVPGFCGRCHVGVMKDYLASAHGRALTRGGPNCVVCHGSHRILKASLELINEKECSRCHSFERAGLIRGAMQETEAMIVSIDSRIRSYKQAGTDTERMEQELFATRNRFHSLFHNVDVKKVTEESAHIKGELKKTEAALAAIDRQQQRRKLIGAVVVAGILIAALLAHLLRKTFD